MSESQPVCNFKLEVDPDYQCPHPVEKNGKCVFHLGEPGEKFQRELRSYLERLRKDSAETWDFRGFIFPDPVKWSVEVESFQKMTNFDEAVFKADADFGKSTFEAFVSFMGSTFEAGGSFWQSTFEAFVSFMGSTFKAYAFFQESIFEVFVTFMGSTFEGGARFHGTDENRCFLGESRFDDLRFGEESQIEFHKVDLGRARFLDTDLERIVFRDVDWAKPQSRLLLRRTSALWDEIRPLKEHLEEDRDYEKIAENYRQLVLNYERKRDYESAEQFHIGEMEMRRKKKGMGASPTWRRKISEWLNTYALYRLLSSYGTSYWQAFVVLIVWVLLVSAAFLFSGFRPAASSAADSTQVIEYEILFPGPNHNSVPIGQFLTDYPRRFCSRFLY